MDTTRLTLLALCFVTCSSFASIAVAGDPKQPVELNRLLAATAAKIPLPQDGSQPSPNPAENAGLVRLYQVRSEVQLTAATVAHSGAAASLSRLSVDND